MVTLLMLNFMVKGVMVVSELFLTFLSKICLGVFWRDCSMVNSKKFPFAKDPSVPVCELVYKPEARV